MSEAIWKLAQSVGFDDYELKPMLEAFAAALSQAGQGGQGEVAAWEVTRMGREPEVMSQAEFTRRSFDTGKFRPLVYGDAAQPAPVPAEVLPSVVTEEMHAAACKVLLRSTGLDGLPQRMLDAMRACAPVPATVGGVAPMTEDQVWHNDALMSANGIAGFKMDALMRIVRAVEAHHRIGQQTAPAAPAGWQLVPVEPSLAMLDAGWGICGGDGCASAEPNRKKINAVRHSFRDLLSAAPKPEHGEGK